MPNPRPKPILCLDFDGVLHSYTSGWKGAEVVADPPVSGAMEFLAEAVKAFTVHIHSSRSHQDGGIQAMQDYVGMHLRCTFDTDEAFQIYNLLEWPTHKPSAMLTIDDRAITFTGVWPTLDELFAFRPWNKKPKEAQ